MGQLISTNEAAKLLGVKPQTLALWRTTGRYNLPFVKAGRLVRYSVDDIEEFIKRRTRTQTDESRGVSTDAEW